MNDPLQASVALEGGELVVRIRVDSRPEDALIALNETGLELKAAKALVRGGQLRAVKIGRRLFVRRSALVGLVDALPAWTAPEVADDDDLGSAVAKAARRKASR